MADGSIDVSVKRRMAGAGRPPPEIAPFDLPRALKIAFAQSADEELGLAAAAGQVEQGRTTIGKLLQDLPEHALLTLLDGPEEQVGLMVTDAQSLAALIEVQTTGRVVPSPAPGRPTTRTDALLVEGFIDRLLRLFREIALDAELEEAAGLDGFRAGQKLADGRAVEMTLPDIPYRQFTIQADYGEGAKQGQILLLLPCALAGADKRVSGAEWQEKFTQIVQCAPVEIEAILARKQMRLRDISDFRPGTLIPLPLEVISQVTLEDLNGATVSMGRLGQADGFRAVRLSGSCADMAESPQAAPAAFDAPAIGAPGATMPEALVELPAPPPQPGPEVGDMAIAADPDQMAGDLPDLAALGESPTDLPDLGSLGEAASETAEMEEMNDLPDLGDLPDLSKL